MRIDKFLKLARIIKQRETVKEFCKRGYIKINGKVAKPSKEINIEDIIEIDSPSKYLKIKVLEIPKSKNVSKKDAKKLYKVLEEKKKDFTLETLKSLETEDEFFKEF